jgi:hypothetical protein
VGTITLEVGVGGITTTGGISAAGFLNVTGTSNPSLNVIADQDNVTIGIATVIGAISSSAAIGDLVIRNFNVGGSKAVHLQSGTGTAAITINNSNNVIFNNASNPVTMGAGGITTTGPVTTGTFTANGSANVFSLKVDSSSAVSTQGAYLQWNRGSQGETWLLNQRGGGTGAIVLGKVTSGNVATAQLTIEDNNNATFLGAIICPLYNSSNFTANTVLTASAGKNITSLATGTNGQVLTQVAGVPAWAAVPSPSSIIGTSIGISAGNNVAIAGATQSVTFLNGSSYSSFGTPNITYSAGVYTNTTQAKTVLVIFTLVTSSNATGYRQGIILKSGTNYSFGQQNAVNGDATQLEISTVMRLDVNDTISFTAFHNAGTTLQLVGGVGVGASIRSIVTVLSL